MLIISFKIKRLIFMSNVISNGLSTLGTLYLWMFPLWGAKRDIYPYFKTAPKLEDFDEEFNSRVLKIFDEFLKKNNVDPNLKVYQKWTGHHMAAFTSLKEKRIMVLPNLLDIDEAAFTHSFKHEISHVKDNDSIKTSLLCSIFSISSMFFLRHYYGFSFISTAIFQKILKEVFKKALHSCIERKADNFAIKNSTQDEIKGGIRFIHAAKEVSDNAPLPFLNYVLGTHQTPSSRKAALEATLNSEYVPSSEELAPLIELLKRNQENVLVERIQEEAGGDQNHLEKS